MIIKKIILPAILCFMFSPASSQTFMHGAGVGTFVDDPRGGDPHVNGALTYSPRINFMETETMSLSFGIPLNIGFSGSYNTNFNGEAHSLGFMFHAPALVNINIGRGSTKENENWFGFSAGAGFGYYYSSYSYSDDYYYGYEDINTSLSAYGPAANLGFRFGVGSGWKNIEARLSFMKGIDESRVNIYGAGALFNF